MSGVACGRRVAPLTQCSLRGRFEPVLAVAREAGMLKESLEGTNGTLKLLAIEASPEHLAFFAFGW
jgi:hypothetical protein